MSAVVAQYVLHIYLPDLAANHLQYQGWLSQCQAIKRSLSAAVESCVRIKHIG